jgi:hypothetical protein
MREIQEPKIERRQVTAYCPRCRRPTTNPATVRVHVVGTDRRTYGAHADCYPELRKR